MLRDKTLLAGREACAAASALDDDVLRKRQSRSSTDNDTDSTASKRRRVSVKQEHHEHVTEAGVAFVGPTRDASAQSTASRGCVSPIDGALGKVATSTHPPANGTLVA